MATTTATTTRGRTIRRAVVASVVMMVSTLFGVGATPAGAELASLPTTGGGVTGLRSGTQTDSIDAPIFAMERIGNVLYVGGRFTDVSPSGGTAQPGLAAFDATTGNVISTFAPAVNGAVYALQASSDGSRLFIGGDFTTVGGVTTGALAAVDPATGALDTSWTGRVGGYQLVRDFDVDAGQLYVGGGFTSISSAAGGRAAYRVARFDLATGNHDPNWRPLIAGGTVWGLDVSPGAGRVYLAGTFDHANGVVASGGFAAIDIATPANSPGVQPLAVNATSVSNQYSYDVVSANGRVYVAGSQYSLQVLSEADLALETFHLSKYHGDYQHLEVIGNRVYAGCHCRQDTMLASANGVLYPGTPPAGQSNAAIFAEAPNSWVTAFDTATGLHISSFRPNIASSGGGVWAIQGDGNGCVWFGGALTGAGGVAQDAMTRLCDTSTFDFARPSTPGKAGVVAVGTDSIELTWNPATDNVGVEGYRLFDAVTNQIVVEVLTNETTLTGVAPGTYTYYVKAYDAAGNQSWRSGFTTVEVTGTAPDTTRPSTPGKPSAAVIGVDSVDLTWTASTDNVAVTGYRIFDSATNAVVLDVLAPAGVEDPNGTVGGLPTGSYGFYAKAYDAAGNESWRSGILIVTVP